MDLFPTIMVAIAGICLYAAILSLFVGLRRHPRDLVHLTFALMSLALAGYVFVVALDGAFDPVAHASPSRAQIALGLVAVVAAFWFVAYYTGARPRPFLLAWTVAWAVVLVLGLISPSGGAAALAARALGSLLLVGLFGYSLFAAGYQYRHGQRRAALLLGAGTSLLLAGLANDLLVDAGALASFPLLAAGAVVFVVAMSLGLSSKGLVAEERLRLDREHLEDLIAERTGALRTLSRAIEQSPSTVVITDPEGRITYANPSFTRLTGYTLDEVRGRNPRFLQSGQHTVAFYRDMWRTLEARDEWRGQFSNKTKGGEIYWEAATMSAVRDEAGALTHYVKVAEDITERKRAEEALQRRVEELAMLNDVAQTIATVTDLPAALERVARTVAHVLDASITAINVLRGDELEVLGWYEREAAGPGVVGRHIPLDREVPAVRRALSAGETLIVPNRQDNLPPPPHREPLPLPAMESVMIVPLLARGTAIGLMEVGTRQAGRVFTPGEVSLAETIAGDLAAAIDNARLQAQARVTAVGEERQRLARDLHDAVTQTIYSASLIAEALPRIWERNPAEAKRNLVKLRQLTRGALAEMRTLLFELRPAALEEASLEALLRQLGDAMTGRTRIPVALNVHEGAPSGLSGEGTGLSPHAKVALYRIAQEAFNNIAKHSGATEVAVALRRTPDRIILDIEDDGQGFDPDAVSGDHLGLGIMAERAASAGAGLEIESRPGAGTRISVTWPVVQPG